MKIQWLRVLLGGLLIEVILAIVLIGGFAAAGVDLSKNISPASSAIIGVGCFAAGFLGVESGTRHRLHECPGVGQVKPTMSFSLLVRWLCRRVVCPDRP